MFDEKTVKRTNIPAPWRKQLEKDKSEDKENEKPVEDSKLDEIEDKVAIEDAVVENAPGATISQSESGHPSAIKILTLLEPEVVEEIVSAKPDDAVEGDGSSTDPLVVDDALSGDIDEEKPETAEPAVEPTPANEQPESAVAEDITKSESDLPEEVTTSDVPTIADEPGVTETTNDVVTEVVIQSISKMRNFKTDR